MHASRAYTSRYARKSPFRVHNVSVYSPRVPYNDLPPIPKDRLETPKTLKAAISASRSLARLDAAGPLIPSQTVLLRAILLQEARASSEIENVVTTNDALYRAFDQDPDASDPHTREVLRYGEALWHGYSDIQKGQPIRPSLIINLAQILKGTSIDIRSGHGCQIVNDRTREVVYTPPVGRDQILEMLDSLCRFLQEERGVDPLIAMAAAHRQFEAIHPFPDGNGRTGRVLNILSLVQSDLLQLPILYLSWHIVRTKSEYYRLLRNVTEKDEWEPWITYMLESVETTTKMTLDMLLRVRQTIESAADLAKAEMKRGYSRELIELIHSQPYTRIQAIQEAGIANRNTGSTYLKELVRIGLLESIPMGRSKLFYNHNLVQALTLE